MKNSIVILFLALLGLASGCKSKQPLVKQEPLPQNVLNLRPENLVVWKQALREGLNKDDLLYFYNTHDIKLAGNFPKLDSLGGLQDGALSSMDTIFYVEKIVPAYTVGRVEDMTRDDEGTIIEMVVWFSFTDGTYKLTYTLEDYARYLEGESIKKGEKIIQRPIYDSGSFILNSQARLLFRGQEAGATADFVSNNGVYNKDEVLLVKRTGKVTPKFVKEKAEGKIGGVNNSLPVTQQQELTKNKEVNLSKKGKSYAPKK